VVDGVSHRSGLSRELGARNPIRFGAIDRPRAGGACHDDGNATIIRTRRHSLVITRRR
jgi:hypothetical protein